MLLLVLVTAVKAQCTFTIATASSFNCLNSAGQLTINIPLSATPPFTVISLPAGFGGTTATNVYTTSNSTVPLGIFLGFAITRRIIGIIGLQPGQRVVEHAHFGGFYLAFFDGQGAIPNVFQINRGGL